MPEDFYKFALDRVSEKIINAILELLRNIQFTLLTKHLPVVKLMLCLYHII